MVRAKTWKATKDPRDAKIVALTTLVNDIDIINIAKVQPNYDYQRNYTNNDRDLERKDAIFHQSIEIFYKLMIFTM